MSSSTLQDKVETPKTVARGARSKTAFNACRVMALSPRALADARADDLCERPVISAAAKAAAVRTARDAVVQIARIAWKAARFCALQLCAS